MEESSRPVVDPALREAYMALCRKAPEADMTDLDLIRAIIKDCQFGKALPGPILRRVAPVIVKRIKELLDEQGQELIWLSVPTDLLTEMKQYRK